VVDYFAALPLADMSDDALAQRAKTLQKLGHLRFDQGRLADAGIALDKAEATSRALLQRDGRREAYCVLLAQTLSWKGRIAWTRGDLDAALAKFREAAKVLDSRRPSEPADDTRAADLVASVHTNIGRVEEAQGDVDHARQEYEFVLRMYEQLVAREPDHLEWKTELGYAHNNLGQLAWNEGRLAKAIDEYSADRRIKSSLSLLAPQDNSRREDLLISNAILGNALFSIGEITMARRYVESAVVDARKLIAIDSNVTGWQEDAGYYEMMLVAILRAQGHLEEASRTADSALTRFRDLVAKDPANAQWLRELVDSETEAARTLLARSSLAGASNTISGALVHARALHEKDPSGSRVSRTIARAQMIAGDVAAAAGHRDDSLKVWRTAEGILQSSAKDRSPAWLELDASIMLRLEKNKLAQESVARLAEMGDRHPDLVADLSSRGMSFPIDNSSRSVIDAAVAGIRKFDGVAATD
jgi:tetratricopeptide (TPR) repeat protein